ncbi:hypothetical protein FM120_36835 [Sphingobacterium faecium PCAi_F2.5]|nr:hypothetical protein FM120_36835 [Sphingobacterium faecium PCAi_F2.5]
MITNRPKFLKENLKYYNKFPAGKNFDIDYKRLPLLLNFDFHTLNGLLPLTKSRFEYLGENGSVNGENSSVLFVNPFEEEYEYYKSIGVTEFQAIQVVMNFYAFEDCPDGSILGLPYSVSLLPMTKNNKIDPWHSDLLKQLDLEELCQEGGSIFTDFSPFKSWTNGIGMDYGMFSNTGYTDYTDTVGFTWGMYFLSPIYDKKEIIIPENQFYSKQINAKFKRHKSNLYFKKFDNTNPRRLYGCDSPIELFLLQGLYIKELHPVIQTSIYKSGDIVANYYEMQNDEVWIGQENLITEVDFYFADKKLAIFCDGKEFHDEEKDRRINLTLEKIGVRALRYSGKQITENLEEVLADIQYHYEN